MGKKLRILGLRSGDRRDTGHPPGDCGPWSRPSFYVNVTYDAAEVGHDESGLPRARATPPGRARTVERMIQQCETGPAASEDYRVVAGRVADRTQRIDVLVQLDAALAKAANRYSLAAEIVRHGWPHNTPAPRGD